MDEYTASEFEVAYKQVYESVITNGIPQKKHCVMFLGGQPGAGKSNIYTQDDCLNGYICIDGDKYRKFHPHCDEIKKYDLASYATRTQSFVNECIGRLIEDLSKEGYNLIIEGTLRDPNVPINTCKLLKNKGYKTDLVVVSVDAITSWEATLNRARMLQDMNEIPRLVPLDKYNLIVNCLPDNMKKIEKEGCFDSIRVIDRNYNELYSNKEKKYLYPGCPLMACDVIERELHLKQWNKKFKEIASDFMESKIDILENQNRTSKKSR